ncbi:MAG: hypothetical protein P4L85_09395 [Paludisphaera borealis]|uniref:hypothetical protein n=1 Tax=Paludisphaera borealis TaxID=1387353 RepID=UPI00283EFA32|nr:hypothetical protein [Paludisphaera borealis]MDR3619552.1 hypothetical protein [Paludisphaera borealis]
MTQLEFDHILSCIDALSPEQMRQLRGELEAKLATKATPAGPSLDPLDVPSRLDALRTLRDGWLDGQGTAPSPGGLDWFAKVFNEFYPDDLPPPYIYPVAEGGIQLEWSIRPREISLEILFSDRSAAWHSLDLETDEEESQSLNLDEPGAWDWLAGRLTAMIGAAG